MRLLRVCAFLLMVGLVVLVSFNAFYLFKRAPAVMRQEGFPLTTLWAAARLLFTQEEIVPVGSNSALLLQKTGSWEPLIAHLALEGWELVGSFAARTHFSRNSELLSVNRRPWTRLFVAYSVDRTDADPALRQIMATKNSPLCACEVMRVISQKVDTDPEFAMKYGGAYYGNGYVVVNLTEEDAFQDSPRFQLVEWRTVEYSYQYLQEVHEAIRQLAQSSQGSALGIRAAATNAITNRVTVFLKDLEKEIMDAVIELIGTDALEFELTSEVINF